MILPGRQQWLGALFLACLLHVVLAFLLILFTDDWQVRKSTEKPQEIGVILADDQPERAIDLRENVAEITVGGPGQEADDKTGRRVEITDPRRDAFALEPTPTAASKAGRTVIDRFGGPPAFPGVNETGTRKPGPAKPSGDPAPTVDALALPALPGPEGPEASVLNPKAPPTPPTPQAAAETGPEGNAQINDTRDTPAQAGVAGINALAPGRAVAFAAAARVTDADASTASPAPQLSAITPPRPSTAWQAGATAAAGRAPDGETPINRSSETPASPDARSAVAPKPNTLNPDKRPALAQQKHAATTHPRRPGGAAMPVAIRQTHTQLNAVATRNADIGSAAQQPEARAAKPVRVKPSTLSPTNAPGRPIRDVRALNPEEAATAVESLGEELKLPSSIKIEGLSNQAPFDGAGGERSRFISLIKQLIQLRVQHPEATDDFEQSGVVLVYLLLTRNGDILERRILEGTGWPSLDLEALRAVERAQPLPVIPDSLPGNLIKMILPVRIERKVAG